MHEPNVARVLAEISETDRVIDIRRLGAQE
jgi:hypothetical protein